MEVFYKEQEGEGLEKYRLDTTQIFIFYLQG